MRCQIERRDERYYGKPFYSCSARRSSPFNTHAQCPMDLIDIVAAKEVTTLYGVCYCWFIDRGFVKSTSAMRTVVAGFTTSS